MQHSPSLTSDDWTYRVKAELPRILCFTLTGAVGFLVDFLVTIFLMNFGLPFWVARIPAFLVAVTVTWIINRSLSFKGVRSVQSTQTEAGGYLAIQSAGFAINWLVSTIAMATALSAVAGWWIFDGTFFAILIGSAVAYIFNYVNLRWFVYGKDLKVGGGDDGNE